MLRSILTISLMYCTSAVAFAQSTEPPPQPAISKFVIPPKTVYDWPASTANLPSLHKIKIVTLTRPALQQSCKVRDVTPETILCGSTHQRTPKSYRREDIAALIDPPFNSDLHGEVVIFSVAAAMLAASFFVPLGWSIALRFLSGFNFYALCWANGSEEDHPHDRLLYQRPNTPLTIHLR